MLNSSLSKLSAVAVVALGSMAQAAVVYSNGPINGAFQGRTITNVGGGDYFCSSDFSVAANTNLTGVQHMGIWTFIGDGPLTLDWSIGTTAFGSDVASGTASLSASFLGFAYDTYSIWDCSFSISGAVNAATTYYLTIGNAVTAASSTSYWDCSSSTPKDLQTSSGTIETLSYELTGDAVPAPGVASLLGLAGVFGGRRRRI